MIFLILYFGLLIDVWGAIYFGVHQNYLLALMCASGAGVLAYLLRCHMEHTHKTNHAKN